MTTIYGILLAGGAVSWMVALADGWTSQDWVVVIGAFSTFAAALFAGYIAIINAKTKAKIEEHRAISEENARHLLEMKSAMQDNASATKQASKDVQTSVDQTKVRVEELTKAVEEIPKA